ncbi:glycoside hydrolase/phage tail family protein [Paracoccaceae bacterium GXU_MW_L88]
MATLVLASVGASLGASFGGAALGATAAIAGRAAGAMIGNMIDQRVLGGGSASVKSGQIERMPLSGAGEGIALRRVWGRMRVPGHVIWASAFKEHSETEKGGGKGASKRPDVTYYSYSVSLAVALCEGEITGIHRIWMDGREVDKEALRFEVYRGTETQDPDPAIAAIEGEEAAPAYRGVAYIVFYDLDITRFGNRVPQIAVEVIRSQVGERVPVSHEITAVAMIPGSGEYALANAPVEMEIGFGDTRLMNVNSAQDKTDLEVSLDHLAAELPRCRASSLVVSWFGDDLRCGDCTLTPRVEQHEADGQRMPWRVSGLSRETARAVSAAEGRPVFGGTPSDESVLEAIEEMAARGLAVTFYPFIMMDIGKGNGLPDPWGQGDEQAAIPWRGRITTARAPGVAGSTDGTEAAEAEVARFFGAAQPSQFMKGTDGALVYTGPAEWSYRRFILHYAHLCKLSGKVEAFCIGTEMRGLTQIRGRDGRYVAVEALCQLAEDVRAILGPEVKIGYAADWSEYFGHHPADGSGDLRFHLDPLWAHEAIDFVGIDNYMPLSDWRDEAGHADEAAGSIYALDYLQGNIEGGEGYDWYYPDADARAAQRRVPITDGAYGEPWVYRYKDIASWWTNPHHERIGGVRQARPTAWVPRSKPIWFTEIGCPAVDKGTNQPNVFFDPKSSESFLPYFSNGGRDDGIQHSYLQAIYSYWRAAENNPVSEKYGGPMVDVNHMFTWAWDTRPWPDFPRQAETWSDGDNYELGHWLPGRTSLVPLRDLVTELAGDVPVETAALYGHLRGYGVSRIESPRASLESLALTHGFDVFDDAGVLRAVTRHARGRETLSREDFVAQEEGDYRREQSGEPVPDQLKLTYVDEARDFQPAEASHLSGDDIKDVAQTEVMVSLLEGEAEAVLRRWTGEIGASSQALSAALPLSKAGLRIGDVVGFEGDLYRIERREQGEMVSIEAVRVDPSAYAPTVKPARPVRRGRRSRGAGVEVSYLDLPGETPRLLCALSSKRAQGAGAVYVSDDGEDLELAALVPQRAVMGMLTAPLAAAPSGVWQHGAPLEVAVIGGTLRGRSAAAVLNGANLAAIGGPGAQDWEIVQFQGATLVGHGRYLLTGLLRGQGGSDALMPDVWPEGSRFVLLDERLAEIDVPAGLRRLARQYRGGPRSAPPGSRSYRAAEVSYVGVAERPLNPVHIRVTREAGRIAARWIRRGRVDADHWGAAEIPLGEVSERYLVRLYRGADLVEETEVNAPFWISAETQPEGRYRVEIAQISASFGHGLFGQGELA